MRYKVTIEAYEGDSTEPCHRVEMVRDGRDESSGRDESLALGILLAGAVQGMCVYDEPNLDCVVSWMLWRMDLDSRFLEAAGEAARGWWISDGDDLTAMHECAAVVVTRKFMELPQYAFVVDELPKGKANG